MSAEPLIDGYPAIRRHSSVDEAENENLVEIAGKCIPCGYQNSRWLARVAGMLPNDELWFSSWGLDEDGLSGAEVLLPVRDGKVVDGLTMSLGVQ